MKKKTHNELEPYLFKSRDALIWLLEQEGIKLTQIGRIFNMHTSNVSRAIARKAVGWKPAHETLFKNLVKK